MAIIATNRKGDGVEPIEAGGYPARIYQLIHLGTVPGFKGELQNKVRVGFELPTELHVFDEAKGPQPRVISQEYTLSFFEKANLYKLITACDPAALAHNEDGSQEEFDVETLIGKSVLLTINQKPKKDGSGRFAFVEGVTRLPKGMECPPLVNPPVVLSYDRWDEATFQALPDFLREKIEASEEFKLMRAGGAAVDAEAAPF